MVIERLAPPKLTYICIPIADRRGYGIFLLGIGRPIGLQWDVIPTYWNLAHGSPQKDELLDRCPRKAFEENVWKEKRKSNRARAEAQRIGCPLQSMERAHQPRDEVTVDDLSVTIASGPRLKRGPDVFVCRYSPGAGGKVIAPAGAVGVISRRLLSWQD
jgi:hypothetical protein